MSCQRTLLLDPCDSKNPELVDNARQAAQLLNEATTILQKGRTSFFGSQFIHKSKLIEAGKCYEEAGNLYEINQNWRNCGTVFREAAALYEEAGPDGSDDAARNYVKAEHYFKKVAESFTTRAISYVLSRLL